ncbi:MAG: phospholipase D-like domain-containing protein [Candidatus Poribacteria bacterium]
MKKFIVVTLLLLLIIGVVIFFVYRSRQPQLIAKLPPWCEIYFSQVYSGNPEVVKKNPRNIDEMLAQKLNFAQRTIDAALYELDSEVIADALIDAYKRGVKVRVVTETDYMTEYSIKRIQRAGIRVANDMGRSGLMHDKFIVIDGRYSWTGSFNTTDNGAYKNNNNAIFIDSPKIAQNFETEFERLCGESAIPLKMFTKKRFGGRSHENIPNPVVRMPDGTEIRTLFSPENDVVDAITSELKRARKSIFFMAFSFTHRKIGQAMIDRYRAGIDVRGIFEKRGSESSYSQYPKMKAIGISVKQDNNRWILHHKVIIIDGETVITGSFNFSNNAAKTNEENILIISGNRAIAKAYLDEFARLYNETISVLPGGTTTILMAYALPKNVNHLREINITIWRVAALAL